jgi:catechol 2,3-dioxygenase-like lactoylglutathione lyase family enzyme
MVRSKRYFNVLRVFISIGLFISGFIYTHAQTSKNQQGDSSTAQLSVKARFEHIAINISDPETMAKWYMDNLGMKLVRGGFAPNASAFIADSGMHMMMELLHNVNYPILESGKIHNTSMHIAFITPDIAQTQKQLVAAGAAITDSLRKTDSGDQVLVLRDPWGLAIQFIQHIKHTLDFTGLYFEHLALNVADSPAKARWYKDNLGMIIMREGPAPVSRFFIADGGKNMMFELYQNKDIPVVNFDTVSYQTFHIAFMVNDIKEVKETLIAAGAKMAEDAKQTPSGDTVMMLRDPWGLPIQFVKRVNPMLK